MKRITIFFALLLTCFSLFSQPSKNKSVNNSMTFDGKTNYLIISEKKVSNVTLGTPNELTLEALINPSIIDGYHAIANKHWCSPQDGGSFHFGLKNGKLKFVWTVTGNCNSYSTITSIKARIKPYQWTHVAVVFKNGQAKLYINGKEQKTEKEGDGKSINITTAPFLIGAYRKLSGEYTMFFDGEIDELRFWKIARSKKEIKKSRKSSINHVTKSLLINLSFETSDKLANTGYYKKEPKCIGDNCP